MGSYWNILYIGFTQNKLTISITDFFIGGASQRQADHWDPLLPFTIYNYAQKRHGCKAKHQKKTRIPDWNANTFVTQIVVQLKVQVVLNLKFVLCPSAMALGCWSSIDN